LKELKKSSSGTEYFGNGWNIFDLTIVVASLLDLGLESVDGISVLRGMRLVSRFRGLKGHTREISCRKFWLRIRVFGFLVSLESYTEGVTK
jgi:hypothetical protein